MANIKGHFQINSTGNYMKQLEKPGRLENILIDFKQAGIVDWSMEVHNELSDEIGVYAITDDENEIIYIGEANGVGGLKIRHANHEKKELFRLFNATKLTVYHLIGSDKGNCGKVSLLERIMIYANEPILNDDIKDSIPTAYFIAKEMERQLEPVVDFYTKLKNLSPVQDKKINSKLDKDSRVLQEIKSLHEGSKRLAELVKNLEDQVLKKEKSIRNYQHRIQKSGRKPQKKQKENLKNRREELKELKNNLKLKKSEYYKTFMELNNYTKSKDKVKEVNDISYNFKLLKSVIEKLENPIDISK